MFCEEAQQALALYVDDELSSASGAACQEHLDQCPVCRAHLSEMRAIKRGLAKLERPAAPAELASDISARLAIEAAARRRQAELPPGLQLINWARAWVMPYAVGSLASVLLFFILFNGLRPHIRALREAEVATREHDEEFLRMIRENNIYILDITKPVPPDVYAAQRAPYSIESPSINPSGSLATLTMFPEHENGELADDDMLVVTDVYSNGVASLASVMQAPRDRRMLEEFESALRKNPAFVPASFDRRPVTMRVVFRIQKVDVIDRGY